MDNINQSTLDILVKIFSIIGPVATSAACIIAIWQTKASNKKKLKVTFSNKVSLLSESVIKEYVCVEAVNIGNRDVIITGVGAYLNNDYSMILMPSLVSLNGTMVGKITTHKLCVEDSVSYYVERINFNNAIQRYVSEGTLNKNAKIRLCARDSSGKEYYCSNKIQVSKYLLI